MKQINKKGFTLVELLVVVLIIGILAAIAVPQYQKAVFKADLHRGVSLVESLYQAQQAYALTHGDFATDIDTLDISLPLNKSCEKTQNTSQSFYQCDFGKIGFWDDFSNVQFQPKKPNQARANNAYLHFLKSIDYRPNLDLFFEEGKRYCFAKRDDTAAISICENMGGTRLAERLSSSWAYYKLN